MSIEIITPTAEKAENLDAEYIERLRAIGEELQAILDHDETLFKFGPTYEVTTSSGQKIQIFTTYFDWTPQDDVPFRKWYSFVFDTQGHIVADRHMTMAHREFGGEKYSKVEGMIATGVKGTGLAFPLERVTLDLLQREANRLGHRVTWHISNANQENLDAIKEQFARTQDPQLVPKIDLMEQQQKRWQQLYGPNGKLGFTDDWNKNFLPDGQDDRLTELESVSLENLATAEKYESNDRTHGRKLIILRKLVEQTRE